MRVRVRVSLALFLILGFAFFAAPTAPAFAAQPAPSGSPAPLFAPLGPDGGPGAWVWDAAGLRWLWVSAADEPPAASIAAAGSEATAPWPPDPAKFWVVTGPTPGSYLVWDVFTFAGGDEGPSVWTPRWRLIAGSAPLGVLP